MLSNLQQAVLDFVSAVGHLFVAATAGSGKTFTGRAFLNSLPRSVRCAFFAFNVSVKNEALALQKSGKLRRDATVKTINGFGWGPIRSYNNGRAPVLNENKTRDALKNALSKEEYAKRGTTVKRLVDIARNSLLSTREDIASKARWYGVEFEDRDLDIAIKALDYHKSETVMIDFTDMLWLPVVLDMNIPSFDWIVVDEAQDLNPCQWELMKRAGRNGRIVAIGDRNQSIYAFRGADIEGVDNFIREFDATELPLDVTYRNPKSHVRLINEMFPGISHVAHEDAIEGTLGELSWDAMLAKLDDQRDDMVLCRVTRHLVTACFALLRMGKKATIKGRDIGKGLITLVRKFKCHDLGDLATALNEWGAREVDRLVKAEKESAAQQVQDKIDTIHVLSSGCQDVPDLINCINTIFSDDAPGIVLSTVHKAKGLEADRVVVLAPELMPHPMAKQAWEMDQEINCQFVAYTRSKDEMYFTPVPPDQD